MEVTRTFHPIGQGAFYSERYYEEGVKFSVVYDCGSSSKNKTDLHREIDHFARDNNKIDTLFVSHFHADHINGIEYLAGKIHIKTLVIPYMDNADMLMAIGAAGADPTIVEYILDPMLLVGGSQQDETRLIRVKGDLEMGQDIDIQNHNANAGSGCVFTHPSIPNWGFVPSYIKDATKQSVFIKELVSLGIDTTNPTTWRGKINDIATAYKKVFTSKINNTSLLLYSGPIKRPSETNFFRNTGAGLEACLEQKGLFCFGLDKGCLYMGDIELTTPSISQHIQDIYKKYFYDIGQITVSHHGSRSADDPSFYRALKHSNRSLINAFISCGTNNDYKHPHSETLISLIRNDYHIIIVTEDSADIYISNHTI